MKLASLNDGTRDGRLTLVSRDLRYAVDAAAIAPSLIFALENWEGVAPQLEARSKELNAGTLPDSFAFDACKAMAPLPRAPQWCDASAFLNHRQLMERAFNTPQIPETATIPLMYQGGSDDFLGPCEDMPVSDEALGIDFEGEFGVIVDEVPMACSVAQAETHVRLLVQINDWSLRALGPYEMVTGFGFFQAKPSTSFAPVAITPDELGNDWREGRVNLNLNVEFNDEWFGHPHGHAMDFSFFELIAHAARTRRLRAGSIIGSGTISNADRTVGSACIAERRVIEILDHGAPRTAFMRFGERVRMTARNTAGDSPFGKIDQRVVQYQLPVD